MNISNSGIPREIPTKKVLLLNVVSAEKQG